MSASLPDYPVLDTRVLPPPPAGEPRDGVPILRDPLVAGDPQVRGSLPADLEDGMDGLIASEAGGDDLANFDFSAMPAQAQDIDAESETLLEVEAMPELAEEPVTEGDDFSTIRPDGQLDLTAQIALDPAQLEALAQSVQSAVERNLQATVETTVRQVVGDILRGDDSPLKALVAHQVTRALNSGKS